MPNYGLVINSRFRPFSYQEMLAPVLQATEAHQAIEEAYDTLGVNAGTVEAMLNQQLDAEAYQQYQEYMKGLQEQAALLAKEGLSPASRTSLMGLKNRYSQDIIPIQQAAERRAKLAEDQRKLGNSMIFDIDASNTGLKSFMDNPALNYKSIDRNDLYKRAVTDFGQLADELASYGKGEAIDEFTNTFVQKYGISKEDATEFINAVREGNIDASNPVLGAIYTSLYNSTGVDEWNNEQAADIVSNTILEGVSAAIGKSHVNPITNQEAVENARYQRELDLLKEKNRMAEAKARRDAEAAALAEANSSGAIVPLRSRMELSDNSQRIEDYIGKGYFEKKADGSYVLTQKGYDALYRANKSGGYDGIGGVVFEFTDFGKFMNELNGGVPVLDWDPNNPHIITEATNIRFHDPRQGNYQGNSNLVTGGENVTLHGRNPYDGYTALGQLFGNYVNANTPTAYDTYHTTEIDIPLDNSQSEAVTEALWRNISSGSKIYEVDFDGNTRTWKNTGESYTSEDLQGYKITALRPSRYGMTAFLHKDGKDDIRIQLPRGVNVGNLEAVQYGMTEVNAWVQAAYSEYKPLLDDEGYIVLDRNGNAIFTNQRSTSTDRMQYMDYANQAKADMIHNSVTIVRPATATTEKH